jgi:putative cell wall-binding protein
MTARPRRWSVVALATLALGLVVPAARAAVATPTVAPSGLGSTTLVTLDPPIDGLREIAVAAGDDRVLAIDRGSLLAYDLAGHLRAHYDAPSAQFGFSDLALDDAGGLAYALSAQGDEVLAFEAPTLRLLGRAKLSDGHCAEALALAGDRVWVAGSCGLASLPPSLEGLTAATGAPPAVYQVQTSLASSGQHSTALYARGVTSEGYVVDRFDLADTSATLAVRQIITGPDYQSPGLSLSVSDDGSTLASGEQLLDGQTLVPRRTLLPGPVRQATFLAGDTHLFGVLPSETSSTAVWSVDHGTPAATFGPGATATVVATSIDRTVGFATDGQTLQQIHFGGEQPRLSLDPRPDPTSSAVSGRLELTDGTAPAGHLVVVERVDLHGATVLGTPTTEVDGRFSVQDPQAAVGTLTYRVRWPGDPAHPDGAFAILPARDGAAAPPAATGGLPAERTLRLRDAPVRQLLADEAHGRVLVLSWTEPIGNLRTDTHVDVYGLDGTPLGELTPSSPPSEMVLTPDGVHLLLLEPVANRVEILDAATLIPFARLGTAPLVHHASTMTVVGTDLWLAGPGAHLRVSLPAPTESRVTTFPWTWFYPRSLVADRSHPGFAYATSTPYPLLERWDLRPDPPVQVAEGVRDAGWFVRPPLSSAVTGAPLRQVDGTGTVDYDPVTLVELGRRYDDAASEGDDEDRQHIVADAAGADAHRFLALEGPAPRSGSVWIGPIQPRVDGHLAVWDGGEQPYRRIPIWDSPTALAVTSSGSVAFVATVGQRSLGSTGEPSEVRRWLRVIPDPFAHAPEPLVAAPDAPPPPPTTTTTTTTPTTEPPTTTTTTMPTSIALTAARLSGPDRIATAVAASQQLWASSAEGGTRPSAGSVVVARADLFADALAGTPLAHHVDGPILLSTSASLDGRTLAEIRRILAPGGTVHLLGGLAALGPSVASDLTAAGYVVARHAGADRYATAVAIAGVLDPSEVFLVTGRAFADGLSAGAAAAHRGAAVLLTDGPTMAPATAAFLAAHPGLATTAVGGPAALAAPGVPAISGTDRYATAVAVAQAVFPSTVTAVGIASGESFADALAGGAHIAHLDGPLLLTRPTSLPSAVLAFVTSHHPRWVLVYGGLQAVGTGVLAALT